MTTESDERPLPRTSSHSPIPWVAAGVFFLIYVVTLNHWMTFSSLPWAARAAGWDWRSAVILPLHSAVTAMFRFVPEKLQFVGLNLFSALCAALTLALLARCVLLLPQDRTREQRHRILGAGASLTGAFIWVPPTIAVLLCGLQLTFWENAIVYTSEMFDLLLFAYAVRCLLEHRRHGKNSWAYQLAFVFGLSATNNWAMIGFFPFFLIALIWMKGLSFFNFRFILGATLWGLAGLSLYLALPIMHSWAADPQLTFMEALRANLSFQKRVLSFFWSVRLYIGVLTLPSLVAALMIGIRWPSFHGDLSATAHFLTDLMFRLVHVMFLILCVAVLFDPPFSARVIVPKVSPYFRPSFLTFHFVTSLCIGYFVAYCIVVFGQESQNSWERPTKSMLKANRLILFLVAAALIAAPVGLVWKNFPQIRHANSPALRNYATEMAQSLPTSGALVLSDDPLRIYLVEGGYRHLGIRNQNVMLETTALNFGYYHRRMREKYRLPGFFIENRKEIDDSAQIGALLKASETHPLFYLHPSFGYYFEYLYPVPHGLVYELKPLPTDFVERPALAAEELTANQKFWNQTAPGVTRLSRMLEKSYDALTVGMYYSRSLNYWGVELQRLGKFTEARDAFALALAANPENLVAEINRGFNANLLKGITDPVQTDTVLTDKLRRHSWQSAVSWFGPFDEPEYCLRLGQVLGEGGNLRQAAQLFFRSSQLAPSRVDARIALGKAYADLGQADKALQMVQDIRTHHQQQLDVTNQFELLRLQTAAHMAKNDFAAAEATVTEAIARNPRDENATAFLAQFYMITGKNTNAIATLEQQLARSPTNTWALFHKARLHMLERSLEKAIPPLNQVIQLEPRNTAAILNRGIAHLQLGQLEEAWSDYRRAEKLAPGPSYQIHYGLAEIAYRRKDKEAAALNYKLYLKYAPASDNPALAAERKLAQDRLKEIQ